MKQKITDIAEHVDFYVGNEHYDKSSEEKQRIWVEKFAELIVRECVSQIQELTPLKIPNETHQKLVDATHIAAVNISVAKIKKHFGVEE